MSSPAQIRLASLMQKREKTSEQYKPLSSLPRAYMFTIDKFSFKQSNYADSKTNQKVFNLIAHFTYADTRMYTYMPKEFSNSDEAEIDETVNVFNKDIKDNVLVKLAYYGVIDGQSKAKIHFGDEGVDEKLVEDVKRWEMSNLDKAEAGSPLKRPRVDSPRKSEFSPKKSDF